MPTDWMTMNGVIEEADVVSRQHRRSDYHFVRPHASLRVVLAQPIERGGRRQPQRYRQRTPAMAAGVTSQRWTVRELLLFPLPSAPIGAG